MHVTEEHVKRFVLELEGGEQFTLLFETSMEGSEWLVTRVEVYDGFIRLLTGIGTGSGDLVVLKSYLDVDNFEDTVHIPVEVSEKIRECYRQLRAAQRMSATSNLGPATP